MGGKKTLINIGVQWKRKRCAPKVLTLDAWHLKIYKIPPQLKPLSWVIESQVSPQRGNGVSVSSRPLHLQVRRRTHWKRRGDRGWDGWMASPTQWTWVWAGSGRQRRTGRPGVRQSVGSQRVGHMEWLNWTELNCWVPSKDMIMLLKVCPVYGLQGWSHLP